MTICRREAKSGKRWDVEWLMPDGTKRSKTFTTLRAAKLFDGEVRSARENGETIDPRAGKTNCMRCTRAGSRPDPICLRRCAEATRTTGGWASDLDRVADALDGLGGRPRLRINGGWTDGCGGSYRAFDHSKRRGTAQIPCGQGRDRTADLPLFRWTERPPACYLVLCL
jgi:hypothetical protein